MTAPSSTFLAEFRNGRFGTLRDGLEGARRRPFLFGEKKNDGGVNVVFAPASRRVRPRVGSALPVVFYVVVRGLDVPARALSQVLGNAVTERPGTSS